MSIRKWFKGAKAKTMIVLGSFAMLLGVGASVSVATAVKENEVVETKAGSESASHMVIWLVDECGFTGNNNDPYVHFTVTTYADGFAYSTVSDVASNIDGISLGGDGNSLDVQMSYQMDNYDGNKRAYKWEAPWYFKSITAYFCNGSKSWYANGTSCSAGTDYRIYVSDGGYGNNANVRTGYSTTASNISVTTYTATFNSNGGSSVSSQTKKQYALFTKPSNPTKTGYNFSKWVVTGSSTEYDFSTAVTADKSLTAQWTGKTYTVTFDKQDGSGGSSSVTATYGSAMPSATMPTRSGYDFGGYFTETGGSGTKYYNADGSSARNWDKTSATTLYAKWTAVPTYTVTFTIAAGKSTYGSLSSLEITGVNSGSSITVSNNTVTIAGTTITATPTAAGAQYTYAFSSWSNTSGTVTANRTITADFTRSVNQYTITWVDGDGNTLDTDTLDYGDTPVYGGATPTKTSTAQYNFTFNDTWSPSITTVTGNATYTAQFDSELRSYNITWKNWDGTTLETDTGVDYGETPVYNGSTPTRAATSQYTYTFTGWTPAVASVTGNQVYTATFTSTAKKYNLTYKYLDVDSSTIKTADVASTSYNASVTLPTPTVSGYQFVSWYESDGFGGTARDAGYVFNMSASAKTFTAKFERIGFYLVTNDNDYTANAASYGSESSGTWTWSGVSFDANDMLKVRYIGSSHSYEDSGWLGYNRLSSSSLAYGNFTQVVGGTNNNNIKATEAGTFDIRLVEGATDGATAIYIDWTPEHTPGYYVVGDETFGGTPDWSVETGIALSGTPTGTDLAKGTHIAIPAGAEFAVTKYVDGHNDVWYNSWGDFPSSCETVTGDAGALNLHYKGSTTAYFDIYVNKDGVIYIVDDAVIDAAGYLYYASTSAAGSISLVVTNMDDTTTISGYLSAVSGLGTDVKVSAFDSKTTLYKIPFYNLRGTFLTAKIKTIAIAGGSAVTVSSLAQNDSKDYYLTGSGYSEAKGAAAKAVFDLDTAMNGKSICDMSESWASLKSSIEAGYAGDSTLMSGAKIYTCASKGDKKTFNTEWNVSDIYKEICRLLGKPSGIGAWPLSINVIPGAPSANQSPLTLTLWIVLGAGVLGLGAIGTAYFVSKKKKRHQA